MRKRGGSDARAPASASGGAGQRRWRTRDHHGLVRADNIGVAHGRSAQCAHSACRSKAASVQAPTAGSGCCSRCCCWRCDRSLPSADDDDVHCDTLQYTAIHGSSPQKAVVRCVTTKNRVRARALELSCAAGAAKRGGRRVSSRANRLVAVGWRWRLGRRKCRRWRRASRRRSSTP